jgi:hypothetical protein
MDYGINLPIKKIKFFLLKLSVPHRHVGTSAWRNLYPVGLIEGEAYLRPRSATHLLLLRLDNIN